MVVSIPISLRHFFTTSLGSHYSAYDRGCPKWMSILTLYIWEFSNFSILQNNGMFENAWKCLKMENA